MYIICDEKETLFGAYTERGWITTLHRTKATPVESEVQASAIIGFHFGGVVPSMIVKEMGKLSSSG